MSGRQKLGEQRMGSGCLWVQGLFGAMEMSWNYIEVMVAQLCECTKCHGAVNLK